MLAVARALMSRPKLLLMDEPSLGLSPMLVSEVFELIAELRDLGVTILLVEQNVRMTLDIVDRAYLVNTGRVEFVGTPDEIRQHADLEQAYLGGGRGQMRTTGGRAGVSTVTWTRSTTVIQYLISSLSLGGLYALMTLGLVVVYGILRLINFAYGELVMVPATVFCSSAQSLALASSRSSA